jgi:Cu(I)/Ag(I) efflux system membrane protein CusA/SilA
MNIADVQSVITSAVGGDNIGETVEGLQRFPINVRYPREIRDSLEKLRKCCPSSANAASGWCWRRGRHPHHRWPADAAQRKRPPVGLGVCRHPRRDLRSAVQDMQKAVAEKVTLPAGYSVSWSGQFEFLERATAKLKVVVPFTLLIIFVLLYLTFRRLDEALLIMATCPSRWLAASGCCGCWATTCRSRVRWVSSRWPACRPSSA